MIRAELAGWWSVEVGCSAPQHTEERLHIRMFSADETAHTKPTRQTHLSVEPTSKFVQNRPRYRSSKIWIHASQKQQKVPFCQVLTASRANERGDNLHTASGPSAIRASQVRNVREPGTRRGAESSKTVTKSSAARHTHSRSFPAHQRAPVYLEGRPAAPAVKDALL